MWIKSYSTVTNKVTKEQMWSLFADVDNWHKWDDGIEYAQLKGEFEKGNHFILKVKDGPKVKVELLETEVNKGFLDVTRFPLAQMYDRHTFEETEEGLRITNTISVKGLLAFVWIKLVAQNIVDALPADVEKQIEAASQR
ncbi:MAG TPA: SRPBCC family protein [Cytophagaceae bacterium]|nr:SRPBCC family protein [Cytophagaceae bacterium]